MEKGYQLYQPIALFIYPIEGDCNYFITSKSCIIFRVSSK